MGRSLLNHSNFRLLWLGQSLILCAVQFWLVVLTWLVLQKTGSGVAIGTVLLAAAVPRALLTLVGGAISDRLLWFLASGIVQENLGVGKRVLRWLGQRQAGLAALCRPSLAYRNWAS